AAGANGFIIPDLPPEEASTLEEHCQRGGLALAYLLAPTSTEARIKLVAQKASGFVYLVSLTGVTGARSELPSALSDFVARARRHVSHPLAVGFGISTLEQAQQVGGLADGVIVGSKLISVAGEANDPVKACGAFARQMVAALKDTDPH
ncbi:MAG: tryptophan synthase subunit alpha, partial [Anaerolineales bacterium]|nr:tryptophan synthase subunit alpha [Anaerolineales bacterium]